MDSITIDSIIRSKRKTIALIITPDAKLVVRAPLRTSNAFIEKLVTEKSAWILRKISELKERPALEKKNFVEGEEFLFLGKKYPLRIVDSSATGITLENLCVTGRTGNEIHKSLTDWYRQQAMKVIGERCLFYSKIVGRKPVSIRISHASRRWGSCSSRGTVCFSWRLILAPPGIIDYVIVHELVHLIHHNHSKRFWDHVAGIMPDYRDRKNWLKIHERMLTL